MRHLVRIVITGTAPPDSGHPGSQRQFRQAVAQRRDTAQVLHDVLDADVPDKHPLAGAVGECRAEHLLTQQDTKRVVQDHPVPVVDQTGSHRVKPAMHLQVVFGLAAPAAGGPFRMDQRVTHNSTS